MTTDEFDSHIRFVTTPMDMLNRAIASGAGMDVLEKLMGLQERWERNQARKAFDLAIAAAKAELPEITKNRQVSFASAKGRTDYKYEDLAQIERAVVPVLSKFGLSYRFRTAALPNEPVSVTCIISHRDGHSEENTLSAGRDETGNKNAIQSLGSAVTYLQRYTLKAALGLAASNDDDGQTAGEAVEEDKPITPGQVVMLQKYIVQAASKDTKDAIPAFLEWSSKNLKHKIDKVEDIPTSYYDFAVTALKNKIKLQAKS